MGTTVSEMPPAQNRLTDGVNGTHVVDAAGGSVIPGTFQENLPRSSEWTQQPQDDTDIAPGNRLGSSGRQGPVSLFLPSGVLQNENPYDRDDQHNIAAVGTAHEQEQRGVSHLSNAVSAVATNGANRQMVAQGSPSGGQVNGLSQMTIGLSNMSSATNVGNQLSLEKRGPVEFNHAIGYVNKIKARLGSVLFRIHHN